MEIRYLFERIAACRFVMRLIECYLDGYRNLNRVRIRPHPKMNIIYGQNAQGKTNLMEGISLFSGGRPLRSASDSKRIGFDRELASLKIWFDDGKREQEAEIVLGRKNRFSCNRVPLQSLSEFSGVFPTVFFSPSHLSIVQGEPRLRRQFLDRAIAQLRPDYATYLGQYERVLTQRNALLKSMKQNAVNYLDVWDRQLSQLGSVISILRQDYVNKMQPILNQIYQGISTGKEVLSASYHSTVFEDAPDQIYSADKVEQYLQALSNSREKDVATGHTAIGIHRDDLSLKIGDLGVREYGSQGQQRSCVIVLKLTEAKLLKNIVGSEPIVLLDDVMSELDESRQDYILNHVKRHQVFITCCDISNTLRLQNGKIYKMENGNCPETEEIKNEM